MTQDQQDERDQAGYEAGLAAWKECMPLVIERLPRKGDASAVPFIAGFLEAVILAMLHVDGEQATEDIMNAAYHNATEHWRLDGPVFSAGQVRTQ